MAEALYRKYRPATFAEVVGQDAIERTLKNAVAQDKVSHAYLFCGPRGTGKTTTARLLAKALLCQAGPTPAPCGICQACTDIARGMHPDVYELDAASRTGVDNVREEIIGRVAYAPTRGRFKIYIIDEVHMLSVAAFNALLKTLEEPPGHVIFVLCTTDPQKVPDTIQSRCQRFDFKRIGAEDIAARLAYVCESEAVEAEPEALSLLARHAKGGMRDALTALEACIVHGSGRVTLAGAREVVGEGDENRSAALLEAVAVRDVPACFAWVNEASDAGVDLMAAATSLAADVRDLYVMAVVGNTRAAGGFGLTEARVETLRRVSGLFGVDRAARALAVLGDLLSELKNAANGRLSFEIALVRLARPGEEMSLEALAERVEALEQRGSAAPVAQVAPVTLTASQVQQENRGADGATARVLPLGGPSRSGLAPASLEDPRPRHPLGDTIKAPVAVSEQSSILTPVPTAAATPPPTPAPVMQAPAPAAPTVTDSQVKAAWPSILAQLRKTSPASCALILHATARVVAPGTLELVFPADKGFAYTAAQSETHRANFDATLTRVMGHTVPFTLKLEGAPGVSRPTPVAAPARTVPQAPVTPRPQAKATVAAPVAEPAPVAPAPEPPHDDVPADLYDDEADAFDAFAAPADVQADDSGMANFFASFGATFEEYE